MSELSTSANSCPQCGAALPSAATKGICPKCLMAEAMLPTQDETEPTPPRKSNTPEELAPHFPQLDILECLGRGGMGVVYKARQKSLNRFIALKLLAPERAKDPSFAERFAKEAQALAALNHPHIVAVHDFGQAGGFYFLLMEFVDGVNLRQAMKAGRFTPEQALAVVPPVCEALQYAHEHGIVHRDIKPENLLLDKDGRVKIADFGIAKILEPGGAELPVGPDIGAAQQRSPTGQETQASAAGTPQYMAPEQTAHRRTDHRADIYSLGVVLYELLTGELPAEKFQPPSRKVQLDVRLDEIVLRALESKPELRYQTAGEFRTRVEAVTRNLDRSAPIPVKQITGILTTPERVGTYRGQLSLFANRGLLALDDQQITHQAEGIQTCIPLAAISNVSIGHLPRGLSPSGQHTIVYVTYEVSGQEQRVLLAPCPSVFGLPSTWNAGVQEWHQAIVNAAEQRTGKRPTVTPVEQVPVPASSPLALAMLIAPPLVAVLGILVPLLLLASATGKSSSSLGALHPLIIGVTVAVLVGGLIWLAIRLRIKRPLIPDGDFADGERPKWNGGAILSGALGLSVWMPVTAVLSNWSGAGVALSIGTAATILAAAWVLWNLRPRIPELQGLWWLLAVGFVSASALLLGAHGLGLSVRSSWPGGAMASPLQFAWILGLFPVVAVWLWLRRRSGNENVPPHLRATLPADPRPRYGCLHVLATIGVTMLVLFAVMIVVYFSAATRAKDLAQQARDAEQQARSAAEAMARNVAAQAATIDSERELISLAQERLQLAQDRMAAGVGSRLEVIEAEGELALAEAWSHPLKQAEARATTATKLLEVREAQYRAGAASAEIVNQARQRKLQAELELQRLRITQPTIPSPKSVAPDPLPNGASNQSIAPGSPTVATEPLALFTPVIDSSLGDSSYRLVSTLVKPRHVVLAEVALVDDRFSTAHTISQLGFYLASADATTDASSRVKWSIEKVTEGEGAWIVRVGGEGGGSKFERTVRLGSRNQGFADVIPAPGQRENPDRGIETSLDPATTTWVTVRPEQSHWVGPGEWNADEWNSLTLFEARDAEGKVQRRLRLRLLVRPMLADAKAPWLGTLLRGGNWEKDLELRTLIGGPPADQPKAETPSVGPTPKPALPKAGTPAEPSKLVPEPKPPLTEKAYARVGVPTATLALPLTNWSVEQNGLRLALRFPDTPEWRIGGQVGVELWVSNTGTQEVRFGQSPRTDAGLSVIARDPGDQEHRADITQYRGYLYYLPWRLPPSHSVKVKEFNVRFDPPGKPGTQGRDAAFQLAPGDYTLYFVWTTPHLPNAPTTDWVGKLTSDGVKMTLLPAATNSTLKVQPGESSSGIPPAAATKRESTK